MIMNQKGKGQDCFETPDLVYQQLNAIFNFTHDAACTSENCKAPNGFYFDKQDNGLVKEWGGAGFFVIHHSPKKLNG